MTWFSGGDPEKEPLRPLVIRNQSWKQQTELENDFFFNTEVGGLLVIESYAGKQRQTKAIEAMTSSHLALYYLL